MNNVTALTLFAGAGGWDLGFAACGVPILAALNHNERSLATHALNFPETEQVKTDVTQDDPRRYPYATILQASPECRYQSASHGVKLLGQNQPGLWTDREEDDPATRSRATMREVVRWAAAKQAQGHPFQLIYVENVTKVRLWGGYYAWLQEMHALGYQARTLYFNSMFAPAFPAPVMSRGIAGTRCSGWLAIARPIWTFTRRRSASTATSRSTPGNPGNALSGPTGTIASSMCIAVLSAQGRWSHSIIPPAQPWIGRIPRPPSERARSRWHKPRWRTSGAAFPAIALPSTLFSTVTMARPFIGRSVTRWVRVPPGTGTR